jgi:hypothetical protein
VRHIYGVARVSGRRWIDGLVGCGIEIAFAIGIVLVVLLFKVMLVVASQAPVKLYWPSGAVRGLRSFIIADSYYIIMSIYFTYDISRPDGRGAYVAGAVRY